MSFGAIELVYLAILVGLTLRCQRPHPTAVGVTLP
jgi:hypothetical protein